MEHMNGVASESRRCRVVLVFCSLLSIQMLRKYTRVGYSELAVHA